MSRWRRGISDIMSTLILVGIFLTIVIATSIYALNVFEISSQNAEFTQAEHNMVSLAQIIEDVSLYPYSSNNLRFNSRVGRLNFVSNWKTISISVSNSTHVREIISSSLNVLEYRGGEMVGVCGERVLRGNDSLIIVNETTPLGLVVEKQEEGAVIRIDFGRIRVIPLGAFSIKNESGVYEDFEIIEVKYINLTLVRVYPGSGPTSVIIENLGVTTISERFKPPISITVTVDGEEEYVSITGNYTVIINFAIADVGLTFRGG